MKVDEFIGILDGTIYVFFVEIVHIGFGSKTIAFTFFFFLAEIVTNSRLADHLFQSPCFFELEYIYALFFSKIHSSIFNSMLELVQNLTKLSSFFPSLKYQLLGYFNFIILEEIRLCFEDIFL